MTTGVDVVRRAVEVQRRGGRYVFGAKGPRNFDCSGFTFEAARLAAGRAILVHGARYQDAQCKRAGRRVSVQRAIDTPGALLFRVGVGQDHVAISLGNGSTIEARGSAYGIGVFKASGRRWTSGGLIPGVTYGAVPAQVKPAPAPAPKPEELTAAQWQAIRRLAAAELMVPWGQQPTITEASHPLAIALLQKVLNVIGSYGLVVDGVFGARTLLALTQLQQFLRITDPIGVAGDHTRWMLQLSLQNIKEGKA